MQPVGYAAWTVQRSFLVASFTLVAVAFLRWIAFGRSAGSSSSDSLEPRGNAAAGSVCGPIGAAPFSRRDIVFEISQRPQRGHGQGRADERQVPEWDSSYR
jgi:hypothetical protein